MRKIKCLSLLLASMVGLMALGCGNQNKNAGKQQAVKWPTKPVQVIVPFSAGGDTDYNARTISKYLEQKLGKPVVVSNVTGSGGAIAASRVKNAAPDGYTILFTHASLNIAAACKTIDFTYKDFEMGGIIGRGLGDAIVVRGDPPWNTVQDMIKDTQANPGKYKMPVATGTTSHWAAIALQNAGAKFNIIDSGNSSDRIVSLLGGQVDAIATGIPAVKDYLKTGQFKMLATCTSERVKDYPNVPTLKENGVDIAYYCNYTMFFPKGTDPAIAKKLNAAVEDIVHNNKQYQEEIKKTYLQEPYCANIEDSTKHWADEYDSLMKISDVLQGKKK